VAAPPKSTLLMRLITLHAAVLAALGCVPVAGQSPADTRPRPNVVTIVADDTFVLFTSDNSGRQMFCV